MEEITRFLCIEPNIEPNMQHKQIICEQQTICFLMCSLDVFLHTQQIVCQQGLFKKRVLAWGDAVRVPEIETVGASGSDLVACPYHKAVFIPFRIRKADVLGAAKQIHADIRADALQYRVGFFLYLKEEQDTLPTGEQEKQDAQGKKGHIPFLQEENKPNKEAAAPGQKGQEQQPQ